MVVRRNYLKAPFIEKMDKQNLNFFFVLCACLIAEILSAPSNQALVVSSTIPPNVKETGKEGESIPAKTLQIYKMNIKSNIHNRFSHTTVTSKVKNYADRAQEAVFSIVLPDSAYISGFIMEVDGKNYTAYVKEKKEAKRVYDQAVASGMGAAHVAVSARDSNRFTVSVNIQPESKAAFYLIYEQLLQRINGRYEQVINIHPGEPVKDLSVEVVIAESRKILDLKAPPLRSGNEIGTDKPELDPRADLEILNDTAAIVSFVPNVERQKELAHVFGTKEENGLAGQFVVQYDVERDPNGGEVLVQDGYFVHFFAPSDLKPLPKQVVFVLDTSGSMWGQKIEQLKQAMVNILGQLNEHDLFNLVEFNSNTKVWNLDDVEKSVWYPRSNRFYHGNLGESTTSLEDAMFPRAYVANTENINKAKLAVGKLKSDGSTSMYGALRVGLRLVELERVQLHDIKRQPIIMFLTDGGPTDLSADDITTKITEFNSEARKSLIIALSFGAGADKKFLQKLSLRNSGFSKHIYEDADSSLQLQDFYQQISSPLLSDVTFKYEPSVTSLTKTEYPIHFGGSEIVVAGFCGTKLPYPVIDGIGIKGPITLRPAVTTSVSNIERLWAYLTIKQLLDKKETSESDTDKLTKQALDLALKHKFVTPLTSLVVVKPNDTSAVDTEEAKGNKRFRPVGMPGQSGVQLAMASFPVPRPGGLAGPIVHHRLHVNSMARFPAYSVPSPRFTAEIPRKSPLQELLENFPWLNSILSHGVVKVPAGSYKLGLNERISGFVPCPKATNNLEGHCTLIHKCPRAVLLTVDDYYDHFCVLKNEFAGVCCPN